MFDTARFDKTPFDTWSEEIGELTVEFPLSVNYVCLGGKYTGRIVCQKGDTLDKAYLTIKDCKGELLPLEQFIVSVNVYDYSSEDVLLTLPAAITGTGTVSVTLNVDTLEQGFYKMKVILDYKGESIIAPSYGFIRLSIV